MPDAVTQITDAAPAAEIAKTKAVDTSITSAAPEAKVEAKVEAIPEIKAEVKVEDKTSPLGEKKVDPAASAVIKYEFKLPEGVKLDEKQLAAFGDLGNKLKLQPEAAQELFDYHYGALKSAQAAAAAAGEKAYNDLIGEWKAGLAADPELSGTNEGPAREIIAKFMDEYGSPEARKAFDVTGAGWNPHIAKMVLKAAKALTEGGPTTVGAPLKSREAKTPGSIFYPAKSN